MIKAAGGRGGAPALDLYHTVANDWGIITANERAAQTSRGLQFCLAKEGASPPQARLFQGCASITGSECIGDA